jgi:Zn-dependent protease
VRLTVLRHQHRESLVVTPRYDAKLGRTLIGIETAPVLRSESFGQAASTSISEMWHVTSLTVTRVSQIFVSESARKEVHSVVGVSSVVSEDFGYSTSAALYLLAIISLSLAIINLFPFLPLDGGHIFWALAEKLRGRPVPFAVMERASVVGFALVLLLFLVGFSNDIHTLSTAASTSTDSAAQAATMLQAFEITAAALGDRVAIRTKDDAQTLTWSEWHRRVRDLAGGCDRLGLRRSETLAILLRQPP